MLIKVLMGLPEKDVITNTESPMLQAAYQCEIADVEDLGSKLEIMPEHEHLVVNSHGSNGTLARSSGRRFTAEDFYTHIREHLVRCGEVHLYACQTGLDAKPYESFGGQLAISLASHFRRPVAVWAPRGNVVYVSGEKRFRIKVNGTGNYHQRNVGWNKYTCLEPGSTILAIQRGEPQAPNEAAFDNDPYNYDIPDDDVDWSAQFVVEEPAE